MGFVKSAFILVVAGMLTALGFYLFDRYARPRLGGGGVAARL